MVFMAAPVIELRPPRSPSDSSRLVGAARSAARASNARWKEPEAQSEWSPDAAARPPFMGAVTCSRSCSSLFAQLKHTFTLSLVQDDISNIINAGVNAIHDLELVATVIHLSAFISNVPSEEKPHVG